MIEQARLYEDPAEDELDIRPVKVTPQMAKELLDANVENNRNIRDSQVEKYARDMLAGRWKNNAACICIATNGRVIDGQHRLSAVIEAGITVPLRIARGLDPDVMDTIDVGVPRRMGDYLKFLNEKHTTAMAAMLRRLWLWERGFRMVRGGNIQASNAELLAVLENNEELARLALSRGTDVRAHFKPLSTAVAGTAFFLFAKCQPDGIRDAHQFFDLLVAGNVSERRHPVLTLRNQLYNAQPTAGGTSRRGKYGENEKLALTIRAWNHFREGGLVEALYVAAAGQKLSNENFPEPK